MKSETFPLKHSIGLKLIKAVFSIYIVVTLVITISQMIAEYSAIQNDLINEVDIVAQTNIDSLSLSLYNFDEVSTKKILKGLTKSPIILGVKVDHESRVKPFTFGKKFDPEKMFRLKYELTHRANSQETKVGTLYLYSGDDVVLTRIRYGFILIILAGLLKTILLIALLIFAFRAILIKPFLKLANAAEKLDFHHMEKFSLGFKKGEKNEFTVIESSMNEMISNLNQAKEDVLISLDKVWDVNKKLQGTNTLLEKKVEIRTKEISEYMNNMKSAIFAIDSNFIILPPVSQFAEHLFGEKIEGKKVSEVLYSQFKRGTQQFVDLTSSLLMIFGQSKIQFLALEDKLPSQVTNFHSKKQGGSIFKISYSPLCGPNDLIEKLMVIVEDVTEYNHYHYQAFTDQNKFFFIKEILSKKEGDKVPEKIEQAIEKSMGLFEDFISPLSDTYPKEHFFEGILEFHLYLKDSLKGFDVLQKNISDIIPDINIWIKDIENAKLNVQVETSEKLCQIIEQLILYAQVIEIISPINYKIKDEILTSLKEKKEDLHKIYRNIFEYIFLVRRIDQIDEEKLKKAVNVAKLYPDFEKTMGLVYQRSKFISFFYKVLMNNDAHKAFDHLAYSVKGLPHQRQLNEKSLKFNLIDPYGKTLEIN
ncbi:hypothetical protein OAK75_01015 [Bacteriovoracales bacterium]|nr:hypothetical protein [Bacteriovoracales bacterium]